MFSRCFGKLRLLSKGGGGVEIFQELRFTHRERA